MFGHINILKQSFKLLFWLLKEDVEFKEEDEVKANGGLVAIQSTPPGTQAQYNQNQKVCYSQFRNILCFLSLLYFIEDFQINKTHQCVYLYSFSIFFFRLKCQFANFIKSDVIKSYPTF